MKRILEYKFPIWGIPILAIIGFATAFMDYVVLILSIRTPAIPSDIARPVGLTPAQAAVIIYLIAAGIVNLFLATGLLLHWNKARILAIFLSPAPVIGVTLYTIYQTLVNQLLTTGQARAIIQLQPLSQTAGLLTFTGISFPSIAPLIGVYSFGTNPTIFLLALLNIGIPIYLKNKHIKTQFQQTPKPT